MLAILRQKKIYLGKLLHSQMHPVATSCLAWTKKAVGPASWSRCLDSMPTELSSSCDRYLILILNHQCRDFVFVPWKFSLANSPLCCEFLGAGRVHTHFWVRFHNF